MEQIFIFLSRFENIQLRYFHSQGSNVQATLQLRKSIIKLVNDALQKVQSHPQKECSTLVNKINRLLNEVLKISDESLKEKIQDSMEPLKAESFVNVLEHSQIAQQILVQTQPVQAQAPHLHRSKSSLRRQRQQQNNDSTPKDKTSTSKLIVQPLEDENLSQSFRISGVSNHVFQAPNTSKHRSYTERQNPTPSLHNDSVHIRKQREHSYTTSHQQISSNRHINTTSGSANDSFSYLQIEMTQEQQLHLCELVRQQNQMLQMQNEEILKLRSQNQNLLLQIQHYKNYISKHGGFSENNFQKID